MYVCDVYHKIGIDIDAYCSALFLADPKNHCVVQDH